MLYLPYIKQRKVVLFSIIFIYQFNIISDLHYVHYHFFCKQIQIMYLFFYFRIMHYKLILLWLFTNWIKGKSKTSGIYLKTFKYLMTNTCTQTCGNLFEMHALKYPINKIMSSIIYTYFYIKNNQTKCKCMLCENRGRRKQFFFFFFGVNQELKG